MSRSNSASTRPWTLNTQGHTKQSANANRRSNWSISNTDHHPVWGHECTHHKHRTTREQQVGSTLRPPPTETTTPDIKSK
ncbi:Hypothetical predicted protein [Pelobates cultripes]|uniref:Uncharacterized protein n=1 Tax=Pelobates cultripes TaxID=61616 RepID=A0AAD1SJX5_PELCU|nr:Hypothetical predicted protein [Pelobates cultripes]